MTDSISIRPISISKESSHLTASGRMVHDIVGPISSPSVGPTLLAQLHDNHYEVSHEAHYHIECEERH